MLTAFICTVNLHHKGCGVTAAPGEAARWRIQFASWCRLLASGGAQASGRAKIRPTAPCAEVLETDTFDGVGENALSAPGSQALDDDLDLKRLS